jgi:hypothetical protein
MQNIARQKSQMLIPAKRCKTFSVYICEKMKKKKIKSYLPSNLSCRTRTWNWLKGE